MPIIKLSNKSFLREHPFSDPITSANPIQDHSYIFPGDEVFLYHEIDLPTDAGVALMSQIKFVSAKVSLIAQKPGVYSEEFANQFAATRNMFLDTFVVAFDNVNAKVVPWGADGYAPNMMLTQDRNWKLPSGDMRRQINFFTKHTPSSTFNYMFYFPVLFRWEYWKAMTNADNAFFDMSLPNNGQNQFWQHYYQAPWIFKSRLELILLVNGVSTTIRTELNMTTMPVALTSDIRNYNSNTDFTNKSIKTSVIGGAPSNTPCLIKSNQDTEVFGYFEKVTPWAANEQGDISAFVWAEPKEGSGITVRTRASSLYPVGNESIFAGLGTSITDDNGIGITDALGNYIVTDNSGNGAMVLFDGVHPLQIQVFALIDYLKLNAIHSGVTDFEIYCRIYDSKMISIGGGKMITKMGEEIKQDAILITIADSNALCDMNQPQCPFVMNVFADAADADDIKNDKSDFYEYGDALFSAIDFTLQKDDTRCAGNWVDKEKISKNSNLGRFFQFGKNPDFSGVTFIDDFGKKYTGVLLEWRKVLAQYGIGRYRIKIERTDINAGVTTTYDNRVFCLYAYNCNLINNSVRVRTKNVGFRGTLFDKRAQVDYAAGWSGEIRLRGVLKYIGSTYVEETTEYGDNDFNIVKPSIDEQTAKFILAIKPIPGWMDFILSTNVLQADEVTVTDYNTRNRFAWVNTPVKKDGDFTPRDNRLLNPLSDVRIPMRYALNNLQRRNSQ